MYIRSFNSQNDNDIDTCSKLLKTPSCFDPITNFLERYEKYNTHLLLKYLPLSVSSKPRSHYEVGFRLGSPRKSQVSRFSSVIRNPVRFYTVENFSMKKYLVSLFTVFQESFFPYF